MCDDITNMDNIYDNSKDIDIICNKVENINDNV